MLNLEDRLKKIGEEGAEAYRQSLIDNDRVATGKTKNSIGYRVKDNTVTIFGAPYIMDLEEGQSAQQIQQQGDLNSQISEWMSARGIPSFLLSRIVRSLRANGWNTTRRNRTGKNGGTDGIITDVTKSIEKNVSKDIVKGSYEAVKKAVSNGINDNR